MPSPPRLIELFFIVSFRIQSPNTITWEVKVQSITQSMGKISKHELAIVVPVRNLD